MPEQRHRVPSRRRWRPRLVFVHCFLDDRYVWNPVIANLTAPGFEIVRLDPAGFGDRTEATGPFTDDRFAADLAAVVDAPDKPFVLVGHSMAAPAECLR
jgi:pimeloyl-ACP methyl ester carboxylesterase